MRKLSTVLKFENVSRKVLSLQPLVEELFCGKRVSKLTITVEFNVNPAYEGHLTINLSEIKQKI